jgi:phosphopentomutase
MYVSFGETDDWAHQRRYDLVLDDLHALDDWFHELWTTLQGVPAYRGSTTLIITTDHGRGRTPRDWTDHGDDVPGAGEIWLAVIGPDTPDVGEGRDTPQAWQADIAATLLQFFGLDAKEFNPEAGPAVPGSFAPLPTAQ